MKHISKVTELVQAVKASNYTRVEKLLTQGVNPNESMPKDDIPSHPGATHALMAAAREKDVEMLKLLVQYGLLIQGSEPIRAAIYQNCSLRVSKEEARSRTLDTIQYLIEQGADLNVQDTMTQKTPLLIAIDEHEKEIVKLLLARGADRTGGLSYAKNQRKELIEMKRRKSSEVAQNEKIIRFLKRDVDMQAVLKAKIKWLREKKGKK